MQDPFLSPPLHDFIIRQLSGGVRAGARERPGSMPLHHTNAATQLSSFTLTTPGHYAGRREYNLRTNQSHRQFA